MAVGHMQLLRWLESHKACDEAMAWIRANKFTANGLWEAMRNVEWIAWLLDKTGLDASGLTLHLVERAKYYGADPSLRGQAAYDAVRGQPMDTSNYEAHKCLGRLSSESSERVCAAIQSIVRAAELSGDKSEHESLLAALRLVVTADDFDAAVAEGLQ